MKKQDQKHKKRQHHIYFNKQGELETNYNIIKGEVKESLYAEAVQGREEGEVI